MQSKKLLLYILVLWSAPLAAQNMNAPYSTYGVGDLNTRQSDRSSGMGYTSIALLSSPGFLLTKNPASLSGLDRSVLQLDLSVVGKSIKYLGNPINTLDNSSRDMTIKQFYISTKLNNVWASGIGVTPFSYVSYLYAGSKTIEGSSKNYSVNYEGDGGLYNVSWNNGFTINKNLSVGVRSSFIFGSINQTETLQSGSLVDSIQAKTKNYYNNLRFEYGAIYKGKLNKNWQFSLGGTFAAKATLLSDRTLTVTEGARVIEQDKELAGIPFRLPTSFGAGIALAHKQHTTFSMDYNYENWNGTNTRGNSWSLVNSQRISAGVQISSRANQYGRTFEKNFFQFGFYSQQSYLRVRNTQVNELGGTIGYGGYLGGGMLGYSLSLEAGRRGTIVNGLIKENFVQFTLALSYREFLFSKGRKYN